MGQTGSAHSGHRARRQSLRRVSLSMMTRRRSNRSKNLSHTFTFVDGELKLEQLNLNTATEEDLMTLPGITREIAVNIVSHRQAIGRFNMVEDLALVSGVGAQRFESIKDEIYVAPSSGSRASSRASLSQDSTGNGGSLLDVNSASVFVLQAIPGLNQKLAASIVERRNRRGPYRSLEELAKVQGMGKHRLAMLRPYLRINVDSDGSITPTPSSDTSSPAWNNPQASSTPLVNGIDRTLQTNGILKTEEPPRANGLRRTLELSSGITEDEIWELLSLASPRPPTPNDFRSKIQGRPSIRVAAWNLDRFSADKATNPGVREVICRTILENRLSLLALQEVQSHEALDKVTHELNMPTLKRVRDWRENRRAWRSLHLGAGLAVLWDSDPKLGIFLREQPPETTVLLPVAASTVFQINKFEVTITSVHTHTAEDNKLIESLCDYENSLLLGDFSSLNDAEFFSQVLPKEGSTSVESDKFNFNDNIVWGRNSEALLSTGVAGVVRQGMTHLGIPQGWRWGGPASNHCAVWCQIFTKPSES